MLQKHLNRHRERVQEIFRQTEIRKRIEQNR